MAVVMYRSQQRSRRGQRIDTSQSQEVRSCLLDVAHSCFLGLFFCITICHFCFVNKRLFSEGVRSMKSH